jgi:hypothetical protein
VNPAPQNESMIFTLTGVLKCVLRVFVACFSQMSIMELQVDKTPETIPDPREYFIQVCVQEMANGVQLAERKPRADH